MLKDGLYSLAYHTPADDDAGSDGALATLRCGRILGSDRWGSVFAGSCEFDPDTRADTIRIRMQIPPGGVLISGYTAGPAGDTLDIVAALEREAPTARTVVELGGERVEVRLTYLGPLPN